MKVIAIFDIGKTNKKFFLFDEQLKEVYKIYTHFEEVMDSDGFPCEDLTTLCSWMRDTLREVSCNPNFDIQYVNFSTYGASFVHLDEAGQPVCPLYNYLKPFPEALLTQFFDRYGPPVNWALRTASPPMGMLNSALQLYWLKHKNAAIFSKIKRSLHLPQYCSFLFTGEYVSEYTSIGCHTGMWDFHANDYHKWIYETGLHHILAPILPTDAIINTHFEGKPLKVGVGIHDSSAALMPYIITNKEPFLLLSTGTWNIVLNPFNEAPLTTEELTQDCLNFLRTDGKPVKAARLFLGNEYNIWIKYLAEFYFQPMDKYKEIKFNPAILEKLNRYPKKVYNWKSINRATFIGEETNLSIFRNYEEAYHKLIQELVELQINSIYLAKGQTQLDKIYVDGGFVDNALFIKMLTLGLEGFEIITNTAPLGSALGAAMVVSKK